MPRLSAFYGIVISMYFADHNPPHFHAIYAEREHTGIVQTAIALLHRVETNNDLVRKDFAIARQDLRPLRIR